LLSESSKARLMESLPEVMAVLEARKALCMMECEEWDAARSGFREFRGRWWSVLVRGG
jgi:hypothetical protein